MELMTNEIYMPEFCVEEVELVEATWISVTTRVIKQL